MKHALKKLMGDCVAGIFLPPMWREETEHTTHYGTTVLYIQPVVYKCPPVNT